MGAAATTPQPVQPVQPVTIDENSAITADAQTVSPAVVTIVSTQAGGNANDPFSIPATGVGSA